MKRVSKQLKKAVKFKNVKSIYKRPLRFCKLASTAITLLVALLVVCAPVSACSTNSNDSNTNIQRGVEVLEANDIMRSENTSQNQQQGTNTQNPQQQETTQDNQDAINNAKTHVEQLCSQAEFSTSVAVVGLSSENANVAFNVFGDVSYTSASMIKLAVLGTFFQLIDTGAYSLDGTYTLLASDIVGGTGNLQTKGAGAVLTYKEITYAMIADSDNVAANILINAVGMQTVNNYAAKIGLQGTQLNRLMMDSAATAQGIENHMSANDAAKILSLIYTKQLASESLCEFAMQALEGQTVTGGIAAGLPSTVTFAHKTGTLTNDEHDGGIVESQKPYIIVVFCEGTSSSFSEAAAHSFMKSVSEVIYGCMEG